AAAARTDDPHGRAERGQGPRDLRLRLRAGARAEPLRGLGSRDPERRAHPAAVPRALSPTGRRAPAGRRPRGSGATPALPLIASFADGRIIWKNASPSTGGSPMPCTLTSSKPYCSSIRRLNDSTDMSSARRHLGQSLTTHIVHRKLHRLTFSMSSLIGR